MTASILLFGSRKGAAFHASFINLATPVQACLVQLGKIRSSQRQLASALFV